MSDSSLDENVLLMPKVRRQWLEYFELKGS